MVVVLGGTRRTPAVERDAAVRLVAQQVDRTAEPRRRGAEHLGNGVELRGVQDAPGGVVRRVEQHRAGPRGDRIGEALGIRREPGRVQAQRDRDGIRAADEQLVEEPRRIEVDDLVPGLGEGADGDGDRAPAPVRHHHILGPPGHAGVAHQTLGSDHRRGLVVERVLEPRRVIGDRVPPQRLHVAGDRHVVGVPEQEIHDAVAGDAGAVR